MTDREDPIKPEDTDGEYVPDPEDFILEPRRPPGPLARFPSPRHVIPALALFLLFYLATAVYNMYPEGDTLWLSGEALFTRHEYWRLLTSLFTHKDMRHLMANALIFIGFGWTLRAYFGLIAFPAASLAIGLITNLITIYFYPPGVRLIGASGMAYGMASLWLVFYIRHDTDHRVPVRIFRAAGFALIMLFPTTFNPQVSYLAHGVGFATGILLGLAILPLVSVRDPA
ncbi:MAG: rhomboid family intramembrane serine protease [Spirochaetes bacterium]|nr:rhomboid family intramembrane serine protease [Spirochaetota bacterium]